jgi:hypothetical protein
MAESGKSSDDPAKTQQTPTDPVADEAVASAASYRRVGQIFTAVLAGIPTIAVLGSLIRAPGDAGFDEGRLIAGLAAVAVSVGIAVALAIVLRLPVDVRDGDADVRSFDMSRVLGARSPTYEALLSDIRGLTGNPNPSPESDKGLKAAVQIRQRVFQLVAADRMRAKVGGPDAIGLFIGTLVFAVIGVFFLATAPKPKASEATAVKLVTVTLTPDGQTALGCEVQSFTALKVGGSDTEPVVVPFDTQCTKGKLLTLTVGETEKLAEKVEAVTPSEVPSASSG